MIKQPKNPFHPGEILLAMNLQVTYDLDKAATAREAAGIKLSPSN